VWNKIKSIWDLLNGNKLKIAGVLSLIMLAVQSLIIEEFGIVSPTWIHVRSIADKIILALGGVGVGHKFVKGVQAYQNRKTTKENVCQ